MSSPTLSAAAAVCGIPDPSASADRLLALPVEQIASRGHRAAAVSVALFQGSRMAQDAAVTVTAAWSSTVAATAIGQTGMAGMAAQAVMGEMAGAIDGAVATMRQLQTLTRSAVQEAEGALRQSGFDPSTGTVPTAPVTHLPFPLSTPGVTSIEGTSTVIGPIVAAARERLLGLESRLETCLSELALALRRDPRDLLQRIPALPPAPPGRVPVSPLPGLARAGVDLLTDSTALTIGAVAGAIGGLLAGGAPGSAVRVGGAVAGTVESTAAAVTNRVADIADDVGARMTPVPTTAAEADAEARARLTADLESSDPSTAQRAANVQRALDQAASSGQTVQLLAYTPATATSQGTAAIGIGDVAAADSVTTMVPGVMNSVDDMSGALNDAARLQTEAHRRSPGESTAVVAWFGYEIPATNGFTPDRARNVGSAFDDEAAVAGAAALKSDLSRFRGFASDSARQVVIGHSMGSVLVSAAAAQGAVIDDLILLGSPGASRMVDSIQDYPNVAPGHTWVLSGDDLVTRAETDVGAATVDGLGKLGKLSTLNPFDAFALLDDLAKDPPGRQFGPDPAAEDFGATVIDAQGSRAQHSLGQWFAQTSRLRGVPLPLQMAGAVIANEVDDFHNHPQGVYLSGSGLTAIADIAVGHMANVSTKPGR